MRNILLAAGVVGVLGLFSACGGDDHAGVVSDGGSSSRSGSKAMGGSHSKAGSAGEGGAAGDSSAGAGAIATNPGDAGSGGQGGEPAPSGTPPAVTLLSPDAVIDPLGGKVLVGDSVNVVCKVADGATPDGRINPDSVKVAVLDKDGLVVSEKPAGLTAMADEYAAALPLTEIPTGKATVRCTAESTSMARGTDTHSTLVDRGPKITLLAPPAEAKLALKDKLKVSFKVEAQPLGAGDTQAVVASTDLKVNGVEIPATPVQGTPGTYEALVDFQSFVTKPNGDTTIGITAPNKRAPTAAVGSKNTNVFVDGAGPIISIKSPGDKSLVGGNVTLSFSVTDTGSGVNADSVSVLLNTETHAFDLAHGWTRDGDNFTFKFDSRTVAEAKVQISITINAEDNVKNAAPPINIATYLDNVTPEVDLDPQNVRTRAINSDCTGSFDPLGAFAVNDLQTNGTGYDFLRVFVWDRTNQIQGSQAQLHFAGTDPNSVRVYFQNPKDAPKLLINSKTPGVGICDEIGDTSRAISMASLAPSNTPWYTGESKASPTSSDCVYPTFAEQLHLCTNNASDMWQTVGHFEGDLSEPAVYARSPSAATKECTGIAWDFTSLVDAADADGFVCFAARAVDKVGNIGVSPPLRLCVDTNTQDNVKPTCATSSIKLPTCTDGCTPVARGGGKVISLN